jgi:hypothetical protein
MVAKASGLAFGALPPGLVGLGNDAPVVQASSHACSAGLLTMTVLYLPYLPYLIGE